MGHRGKRLADFRTAESRGIRHADGCPPVLPASLLAILWQRRHVEIDDVQVKVSKGLKRYTVRLEDVVAVFTTMMPKGRGFQEVLAIEFLVATKGGGVLALDPAWGFDLADAMGALREALGDRWEELYLGHKHASTVRGIF